MIEAVIRGGMSRRAAAARFGVSESSAIKWVQRFERSGSRAASRMGGYLRPKLEPHREFLEALRGEKSDITLKALCDRLLAERGVKADTSMMSRFFRRLGVTLKNVWPAPSARRFGEIDGCQSASTYPASEVLLPAKMEIRAFRSS